MPLARLGIPTPVTIATLCSISAEAFIICKGLALPEGITSDSLMGQWKQDRDQAEWTPTERLLLPFLFGLSLTSFSSCSEHFHC